MKDAEVLVEGKLGLHMTLTVPMSDLSTWSAARIQAFLSGIARVVALQKMDPAEAERFLEECKAERAKLTEAIAAVDQAITKVEGRVEG